MEEYKIGDIVDIDGIKYIVKEEIEKGRCTGCAFCDQNTDCNDVFMACNTINCIFVKFEENKTKEEYKKKLRKQYNYEKSLLEMYGYNSVIGFEEWLTIKKNKLSNIEFKQNRFDPKTLQPFDKVIVRLENQTFWSIDLFSFVETKNVKCVGGYFNRCIPYNDETKHLIGTKDEAPEYYRYWED